MSNANKAVAAQATTAAAPRKEMGFFRSLASPVYALGKFFSAVERTANVVDMYAQKLEVETEIQLVPALTSLELARQAMQQKIAAGNIDDASKPNG